MSPHFTSLLESAILPALVMNENVISTVWESHFINFQGQIPNLNKFSSTNRISQSGKKMRMSTCGRIFHLTLYVNTIISVSVLTSIGK